MTPRPLWLRLVVELAASAVIAAVLGGIGRILETREGGR